MREILKKLNQDADVLGSMVMTPDGIMVAAAVSSELEEDVVAAFASSLLITLKRSINQLKTKSSFSFCSLNATKGKLVFFDMNNSYLVVVTNPNTQIASRIVAIEQAIDDIQNRQVA